MRKIILVLFALSFVGTCFAQDVKLYGEDGTYLGKVSNNKYDPESISNPNGQYGSKYSSTSINNPYGKYGSAYSNQSARNPYATDAPTIIGSDQTDTTNLGHLSNNKYDAQSTGNRFGQYGSQFSPTSINNPYSKWGTAVKR